MPAASADTCCTGWLTVFDTRNGKLRGHKIAVAKLGMLGVFRALRLWPSRQVYQAQAVGPGLAALQVALPRPLPVGHPPVCICKAVVLHYRGNPAGGGSVAAMGHGCACGGPSAGPGFKFPSDEPARGLSSYRLDRRQPARPSTKAPAVLTAAHPAAQAQLAAHTRCGSWAIPGPVGQQGERWGGAGWRRAFQG